VTAKDQRPVALEHLVRGFDHDAHLVVVLAAGDPGAMRSRADLDQEDR
jgi:hypothetical protein